MSVLPCMMGFLFMLAFGQPAAAADALDDLAWLAGHWEGTGVNGAPASETYSNRAGGQIVGHFRQLTADGRVMFYELITFDIANDRLRLRLKHFNADLTGWEERAVVREFPFRSRVGNRWDFSGLIIERIGRNGMRASVEIEQKGKRETLVFRYRRTHD